MTLLPLRAACIHGRYEKHPMGSGRDLLTARYVCPGGRIVTDNDLRAMLDDLAKEMDRPRDYDEAGG